MAVASQIVHLNNSGDFLPMRSGRDPRPTGQGRGVRGASAAAPLPPRGHQAPGNAPLPPSAPVFATMAPSSPDAGQIAPEPECLRETLI